MQYVKRQYPLIVCDFVNIINEFCESYIILLFSKKLKLHENILLASTTSKCIKFQTSPCLNSLGGISLTGYINLYLHFIHVACISMQ